jgi:hypothetical protein
LNFPAGGQKMPEELKQPADDCTPSTIEEQKTRLWALSFESARQVIHCQSCGEPNVVSRLVANQDAQPERRKQSEVGYRTGPDLEPTPALTDSTITNPGKADSGCKYTSPPARFSRADLAPANAAPGLSAVSNTSSGPVEADPPSSNQNITVGPSTAKLENPSRSKDKQTIRILSALSATLLATLVTVLVAGSCRPSHRPGAKRKGGGVL